MRRLILGTLLVLGLLASPAAAGTPGDPRELDALAGARGSSAEPAERLAKPKVRRTIRYEVRTRGRISADVRVFRRQVQETLDHRRGWRAAGIRFVRVPRGGSMTVVLAEAATVPTFSSGCSATWSCRVGRYVVINQARWLTASPAWNASRGTLRDYRHMVVNHEVGHFLGLGHVGCPRPGVKAPVMMQQSKGLGGCRFNPWPTPGEIASRR